MPFPLPEDVSNPHQTITSSPAFPIDLKAIQTRMGRPGGRHQHPWLATEAVLVKAQLTVNYICNLKNDFSTWHYSQGNMI